MPICPLWTGLIIGPSKFPGKVNVTFTNSIVENWMRIVKKNNLKEESKLRPGDFIRKMYEGICGRIKVFELAFLPISCKVIKKTKITNKIDDTQIEEIWGKSKKKRGYFKPYQISKKSDSILLKSGQKELFKSHRKNTKFLGKKSSSIRSGNSQIKQEFRSNEISSDDSIFENLEEVKLYY